jgi:hypothetical protein
MPWAFDDEQSEEGVIRDVMIGKAYHADGHQRMPGPRDNLPAAQYVHRQGTCCGPAAF